MSENANIAVAGKKMYIAEIIKVVAAALIFSLLLVLLSAFVIKFFNVPSGAVPVINQIIRRCIVKICHCHIILFREYSKCSSNIFPLKFSK